MTEVERLIRDIVTNYGCMIGAEIKKLVDAIYSEVRKDMEHACSVCVKADRITTTADDES
jgi:ribosomal protein L37AE/L43A